MKKFLLIGLIIGVVLILVGGAGAVYAQVRGLDNNANANVVIQQNENQSQQPFNYGPGGMMQGYGYDPGGMMDGYGYGPGGMMGGGGRNLTRGMGFMHDYIITAFASAVGLSVDQVNTDLSNGQTLTQIANTQGFTGDKLTQLVTQVHQAALAQAVKDGVITQSQADQMLQRMNSFTGNGFGPGSGFDCPMWDGDEGQPTY